MRVRMASWMLHIEKRRTSAWFYWLSPFASILIAILLQIVAVSLGASKTNFPFAFFYLLAVFATAWLAGAVPGVAAVLLTMVGLPLAITPKFSLANIELVKLAAFSGVSLLVSAVAKAQRRAQERLREANSELDRRVEVRTAELAKTVALIQSEVEERKRTELALRESEQRVDLTLDAAGIGRWDLDIATGILTCSPKFDRIFGYEAGFSEWTYEAFLRLLHADDRPNAVNALESAMATGELVEFDTRIRRADGESRWVWMRGKVLRDPTGEAVSMLGSLHDITRRKLAEERLQIQLARLTLLDHITRGIGERQDLRSIYQAVVRSLEDNLPIDFGCICLYEPIGATLRVTCVGTRSAEFATGLVMAEHSSIPIDTNGLSYCVKGHLVYEPDVQLLDFPFPQLIARAGLRSLVAAPLLVANEIFGVVIVARKQVNGFDSSDCEFLRQLSEHVALAAHQAQIREALQQAYDDLHQSQQTVMQQERLRAVGQMASGIAHDINNAISPVTLYTESLLETEPNLSARARQYLETIHRAIDDVAETVSRMREFYRQQEPQLVLSRVGVGLLGRQVIELTEPQWSDIAQRRGATIRALADLDPRLPEVLGIESEIREALTNLILNAVDAMPNGGDLTVRTRVGVGDDGAPRVFVEVSDTGIGMDDDTRRRCLEPFFTTKGERGTGLGLAMVYGVAQRHNALVEIDSTPGVGTTARLVFPVAEAEAGAAEPVAYAPAPIKRVRILVVDDDPLLTRSLCDTLQIDGHSVVTADGGEAGILAFQREAEAGEPFSLVITDLGMPYTDGRKVASAIKAASASTPVILLTGWGQRLIEDGEIPPDVDRILSKPPKLRELRAALADCNLELAKNAVERHPVLSAKE